MLYSASNVILSSEHIESGKKKAKQLDMRSSS